MSRNNVIFKINQVIRAIEERSGLGDLDLTAKEILRFIGEGEAARKRINVTEIVRHTEFGSPPTIFTRISRLEEEGWIAYAPDPTDGRVRNVELTAKARKAFTQMSAAATKAIVGEN